MDKNKKNEIVKMLLKRKEDVNEEELIELLFDQPIAVDVDKLEKNNMKFKDKLADKITSIVGSWLFIILFGLLLVIWILVNILFVKSDNSSLILNLFLSCVAAFQAPIIMMSQNRQAAKDSLRNQNDYRTDLKSELILESLHDHINVIIKNQRKIIKLLEEEDSDDSQN